MLKNSKIKRIITAVMLVMTLLFTQSLVGCSGGGDDPAVSITISGVPASQTVSLGDTYNLKSVITVKDGSGKDVTSDSSFTFHSFSTAVASVGTNGVISALSVGTAKVEVRAKYSGATASADVVITVEQKSTSITINGLIKSKTMNVGDVFDLSSGVTVIDEAGIVIPSATLSFASETPAVATVDADGNVSAKKSGQTSIAVTASAKGVSTTEYSTITVSSSINSIRITGLPSRLNMMATETFNLYDVVSTLDQNDNPVPAEYTFNSALKSVAEVLDGVIHAKKEGKVNITVTANYESLSSSASTYLTVVPFEHKLAITDIDNNNTAYVLKSKTYDLKSKIGVTYNAEDVKSGADISFSSASTSVLSINSATGVITPVANGTGTVKITARYSGEEVEKSVSVVVSDIVSIEMSMATGSDVGIGSSTSLYALVKFGAANKVISDSSVEFLSDDTGVIVISGSTANGVSLGKAKVSARSNYYGVVSASDKSIEMETYKASIGVADESIVNYYGRDFITSEKITFIHSQSGFEVEFYGQELKAKMKTINYIEATKIRVIVDDAFVTDGDPAKVGDPIMVGTTETVVTLASFATKGRHKVLVRKVNYELHGILELTEIFGAEKYFAAPAQKQRKIAFYGDSITVGYGVNNLPGVGDTVANEDNGYSYATLTADHYNAQAQLFCISGISIGNPHWRTVLMKDIFENYGFNYNTKYDLTKFMADLVVINLGTNDNGGTATGSDATAVVKAAYKEMMTKLRAYYPYTPIICCYGMMGTAVDIYNGIYNAVTELGGASQGYYFLNFTKVEAGKDTGHPTRAGQRDGYNQLKTLIDAIGLFPV